MTPLWTQSELRDATGTHAPAVVATGVSIDTRSLVPGDLFVALRGERGDGHDYVAEALARGAAAAMVARPLAGVDPARLLRVADTLAGLHALGRYARTRTPARVVAVTGSVGKTTTKEMLRALLATAGLTHAAHASYNNHWGVPLTLSRMPRTARFAIIEIGMNHAGEIAPLAALARPHVAVITAIAPAHIGNLGSIEAIADEKAALLGGLEPGGTAVLPADSPWLPRLRARADTARAAVRPFGTAAAADARLLSVNADADGSDVRARIGDRDLHFRLGAPGAHMAANALAALAAVAALGLDPAEAAPALAAFAPVGGRGRRERLAVDGGHAILLDESYNASPAAVGAALEVLKIQAATRRIAALGDMLELGTAGASEHSALAPLVASAADVLFTCGPLMRLLHDAVPPRIRGAHTENSEALAPLVAAALRPGDAVLVKGSLGSRMNIVVNALRAAHPAEVR